MTLAHLVAIALALAVDAFAVAVATGIRLKKVAFRQVFRLSWHFGIFQAGMTGFGWGAGYGIRNAVARWDHWVAFGLLCLVGGNMIRESLFGGEEAMEGPQQDPTRGIRLVMLSVATSLDALAVGFSFSVMEISIFRPMFLIGIVALFMTAAGLYGGSRVAQLKRVGNGAEMIGGLLLIAIGIRILLEHGVRF